MRVLGVRCSKDSIAWVVLEGTDRSDAKVVTSEEAPVAPKGTSPDVRAAQLLWAWKETTEIVGRTGAESAGIKVNEAATGGAGRCEVEGVVQAALADAGLTVKRFKAASFRSAFKAANRNEVALNAGAYPAVTNSAKVRHEQIMVALAAFPIP